MATLILIDDQKASLSIKPVDAKGKPAIVDGVPVWASSNPDVIAVTGAADGMSATIVAGEPGDAQVSVSADADMGTGTKAITGTLDVRVNAGEAISLAVTAGTPEQQ